MLRQDDGPRALLERAGANVPGLLAAAEAAVKRLPQVTGQDQVQGGPELGRVLQATEKEAIKRGDQFIASELFLLALTDSKGEAARIAKENGLTRKSLEAAIEAVRGGQKMDSAEGEGQRVGDQGIIVHHQQGGLAMRRGLRQRCHGGTS